VLGTQIAHEGVNLLSGHAWHGDEVHDFLLRSELPLAHYGLRRARKDDCQRVLMSPGRNPSELQAADSIFGYLERIVYLSLHS